VQEHCPPEKSFTSRQSPFTNRYPLRLAHLPTCRFADKFWLGSIIAFPNFSRPNSFRFGTLIMEGCCVDNEGASLFKKPPQQILAVFHDSPKTEKRCCVFKS
jgi:hypothetical protein